MTQDTVASAGTLVLKRTLAAPVEKVWRAWTDPAQMARWFFPNERWNQSTLDIDPVPGGRFSVKMNHSDGDVFHLTGHYVEVTPRERLVFTWSGKHGDDCTDESLVTVELKPAAAGTELTLTHERITAAEEREQTQAGWTGCLETLAKFLGDAAPAGG